MKQKNLYSLLAAAALMITAASCQNNDSINEGPKNPNIDLTEVYGTGSKIVTLNVSPEANIGTRAEGTRISDGSKVTMLYFEVYRVEGVNPVTATPHIPLTTYATTKFPVTLKLAVDPESSYKIALWAQHTETGSNSEIVTAPYTIASKPLTITVDYANAKNNDELRDAFCVVSDVFTGSAGNVSVVLHRPFAQINVGTTVADYNNYKEGNILPNLEVTKSHIVVSGVHNTLNVLTDETSYVATGSSETTTTATFALNTIPNHISDKSTEEYLRVKLNDPTWTKIDWGGGAVQTNNDGFFPFKNTYPTLKTKKVGDGITVTGASTDIADNTKLYLTEEFKYLSMCYVLVPSGNPANNNHSGDKSGFPSDKYTSSLVDVDVYFAGNDKDNKELEERKYFSLNNIPVHRNWRTNILGGLADTEPGEPDDPNKPDDPSSLFANIKIAVNLCPIYWGEYFGTDGQKTTTWVQNTFPRTGDDNLHKEVGKNSGN